MFANISLFIRQCLEQLRLVVWPTLSQWRAFTIAVLAFTVVVVAFIAAADYVFSKAVFFFLG